MLVVPSGIAGGLEHALKAQRPCRPDSLLEETDRPEPATGKSGPRALGEPEKTGFGETGETWGRAGTIPTIGMTGAYLQGGESPAWQMVGTQ